MIILLTVVLVCLFCYIIIMRRQLRNMNRLLQKRIQKGTNQVVSLELYDKELNQLAENVNICLKAEETLRLKVIHEERDFKDLIANISHDLRTPLTAVKGYLQLLEKSDLTAEQREKLSIAQKHTMELGDRVEQFFEYAYLMDSNPVIEKKRINLTNLVMEGIAAVIPALEEKKLDTRLEEQPIYIKGDLGMTKRIVENLIRNCIVHAVEYIAICYSREKDQVTMHVKNPIIKGEEIVPEQLFERFYVGNRARQTTGLGLAIVKLLVTQMGGSAKASIENQVLDIQISFLSAENANTL
ncbi:sensor histidine kinase [Anaerosporobacter faecicola]|uniref:sensor histidine kinase n=1 Tax=Anaerosporobacter faecicola TaxID=2718714 RepID=UPI00143A5529|nr:HAMP domain-containing sensor histidine kinase [Anaerosporobacter faecicola]